MLHKASPLNFVCSSANRRQKFDKNNIVLLPFVGYLLLSVTNQLSVLQLHCAYFKIMQTYVVKYRSIDEIQQKHGMHWPRIIQVPCVFH